MQSFVSLKLQFMMMTICRAWICPFCNSMLIALSKQTKKDRKKEILQLDSFVEVTAKIGNIENMMAWFLSRGVMQNFCYYFKEWNFFSQLHRTVFIFLCGWFVPSPLLRCFCATTILLQHRMYCMELHLKFVNCCDFLVILFSSIFFQLFDAMSLF